jgi:hypothetical protein
VPFNLVSNFSLDLPVIAAHNFAYDFY